MFKRLLLLAIFAPGMALAAFIPPITILLDHRDIELKPNAGFTRTTEWMVRIDTQQGVELNGQAKLYFDGKRAKQTIVEAYTIKPDGEKIPVAADRIKVRSSDTDELAPYFSDQMNTVIIYPQVEVGSKLYYKAVTVQNEPVIKGQYSASMYFTPHRRYENTRIRLTHPPELPVLASARDVQGTRNVLPDGRIQYVYRFKQSNAYPPEPNRVELSDFAPGVQFSTFKDYSDLAATFQSLFQPKTLVTPTVQRLANQLTRNASTNREKAKRLYDWISANIRYVGVDVGSSGYEPHTADEILASRYGDCKDHTVLLESFLLAVGIPSSPALINASDAYRLPELAGTNFDHVITYVPELDLYLDSTAQFADFGTLPPSAQGKPTLLTQTGTTHATPPSSSKDDYTVSHTKMQLMEDGRMIGTTSYIPYGAFISSSRSAQFSYEDQENQSVVDTLLSRFGESGTGEMAHGDPNDLSKPWKVTSKFELNPVINLPGPSAMTIPIGLSPGFIKAHAKERTVANRRYPYVCGSDRHIEVTEITFPDSVKIKKVPESKTVESDSLSYKSSYSLQGNQLMARRELNILEPGKDSCGQKEEKFKERNLGLDVVKSDLRSQVFME